MQPSLSLSDCSIRDDDFLHSFSVSVTLNPSISHHHMDLQYSACKAFYWLYFFKRFTVKDLKTSIQTGSDDAIDLYL